MRPKERIKPFLKLIEEAWMKKPDYRFTQVLIGLGIVPNTSGAWFYQEEHDLFPDNVRDLLFWGTYGKDGNQPYKAIALKDMSTNHIETVLATQDHISDDYKEALEAELKSR